MTINIAVVTSEALVLGCDSISSVTQYFVDPFSNHFQDVGDGKYQLSFFMKDLVPQVTNSWDGVTKMFALSLDARVPVAAVTAGLAKLKDRSMKSYADEFLRDGAANILREHTVEEVARNFLAFMRRHYDIHYADSPLPPELREGPLFLLGGYNAANHLPSLFRISVQGNRVVPQYAPGGFGIAWEGQSDAVERLIRGYDTLLMRSVESQVTAGFTDLRKTMGGAAARMLQDVLDRANIALPEGINTELPEAPAFSIDWDGFKCNIAYGNLPIQDAIDLAAYLVGLQSGKAKFASGVATVGGRTHIGLITKQEPFRMLDEPELHYMRVGPT
jgi:hypothetical protein